MRDNRITYLAFGIGHGNKNGYYYKASIGFERIEGLSYFAEFLQYGF